MAIGGNLGVEAYLRGAAGARELSSPAAALFSESNGRYIVEVRSEDRTTFETTVQEVPHGLIGRVRAEPILALFGAEPVLSTPPIPLTVNGGVDAPLLFLSVAALRRAWQGRAEQVE